MKRGIFLIRKLSPIHYLDTVECKTIREARELDAKTPRRPDEIREIAIHQYGPKDYYLPPAFKIIPLQNHPPFSGAIMATQARKKFLVERQVQRMRERWANICLDPHNPALVDHFKKELDLLESLQNIIPTGV